MFKFIKTLLLGHKHDWQYFLCYDQDARRIAARYCHNCHKWQVQEQGIWRNSQKPHIDSKGRYWI